MKTKRIKFIFRGLFGCFVLGAMIWMIKFCFPINSPWGMPIEYERKEESFIIKSSGRDKIIGTEDDITN